MKKNTHYFLVLKIFLLVWLAQSSRYDRSITLFSPEGFLEQVGYADKAVQLGSPVLAVTNGDNSIAICSEKISTGEKLQDIASFQKIRKIDEHICIAFAGLKADGRVLCQKIRLECQQYRFSMGQPPSIEFVASKIADIQYSQTRRPGARPFGVSCVLVGFDESHRPRIFRIDPSGFYAEWKGVAIGRSAEKIETAVLADETRLDGCTPAELGKLALRATLSVLEENTDCELVLLTDDNCKSFTKRFEAVCSIGQFEQTLASD